MYMHVISPETGFRPKSSSSSSTLSKSDGFVVFYFYIYVEYVSMFEMRICERAPVTQYIIHTYIFFMLQHKVEQASLALKYWLLS